MPSTNPTSTAIYKILIAIKARCPIVISPHPSAVRCITRVAEIMDEAARRAGAPDGAINWMTTVTLEGTQELMKAREVAVILATGGMGLVRAAYSAGKPAYGVGPGNAPAYIERTRRVAKAVRDIVTGKTFDNGVLCSSRELGRGRRADRRGSEARSSSANGGHFLSAAEIDALGAAARHAAAAAEPGAGRQAGHRTSRETGRDHGARRHARLIAELTGVGRDYPLSIEKLCPVLSFYVVKDWREGCERCKQILRYGGMGHTMSIHSRNDDVILQFGLKKPAFRIVVNTPTTLGSIGLTTGLDPAMTLGCGGYGGNITSDNISPRHLLNIKRLAYETSPAPADACGSACGDATAESAAAAARYRGHSPPSRSPGASDQFLASRGYTPPPAIASSCGSSGFSRSAEAVRPRRQPPASAANAGRQSSSAKPAEFVCEDDVRQAVRRGAKS